MREQQLSGWPPREPDTRRFVEKKEHRGDGETAIRPAAEAGRKNRQRTAFVDGRRWRIDRLFAVLRLAGRKIRDWLAAVRNATSGRDASRVDRRHSAGLGEPRIPAITIVLVQQSWYRRC